MEIIRRGVKIKYFKFYIVIVYYQLTQGKQQKERRGNIKFKKVKSIIA
jgi:hypothetical protein